MKTLTGGGGDWEDKPDGVDMEMWEIGRSIFFMPLVDRPIAQCWMCGTLKFIFKGLYVCPWCDCFHQCENHRVCECHKPRQA